MQSATTFLSLKCKKMCLKTTTNKLFSVKKWEANIMHVSVIIFTLVLLYDAKFLLMPFRTAKFIELHKIN